MGLALDLARILLLLAIVGGMAVFIFKRISSNKEYRISIMISFGTMALLYLVGFIFEIEFLLFKITSSRTEVSLLPIIIGLLLAFVGDKMVDSKLRKRENKIMWYSIVGCDFWKASYISYYRKEGLLWKKII